MKPIADPWYQIVKASGIPDAKGVSNCWNGIWNGMVEWKMKWNDECIQLQLTRVTGAVLQD